MPSSGDRDQVAGAQRSSRWGRAASRRACRSRRRATSRAKPLRAAAELGLGEHELGDVGGAGDEHDRAGGENEQRVRRSLRTLCVFAGLPRSSAGAAGFSWPRRRVSRRAETAKVRALRREHESRARRRAGRRRRARGRAAGRSRAPRRRCRWPACRLLGVTIAGSSAQVAGRSSALPRPASEGERDQLRSRRGRRRGRRRRARRSRRRRSRSRGGSCGRSGHRAAGRAASRGRGPRAAPRSRPRRAELLVREQQQRDVAGAGAERALEVGGEEPAAVVGGRHGTQRRTGRQNASKGTGNPGKPTVDRRRRDRHGRGECGASSPTLASRSRSSSRSRMPRPTRTA